MVLSRIKAQRDAEAPHRPAHDLLQRKKCALQTEVQRMLRDKDELETDSEKPETDEEPEKAIPGAPPPGNPCDDKFEKDSDKTLEKKEYVCGILVVERSDVHGEVELDEDGWPIGVDPELKKSAATEIDSDMPEDSQPPA